MTVPPKDPGRDTEAQQEQNDRLNGNDFANRPPSRRRRILHAAQLVLALVLIGLVLAYVQIKDEIKIPSGDAISGEHGGISGEHGGTITRGDGRTVFKTSDGWTIELVFTESKSPSGETKLTATAGETIAPDGTRTSLSENQLSAIKLREGLITILKRTDRKLYFQAFLIYILAYLCGIARWKLLLDAAGLHTSMSSAARLTCIGLFFNNLVPGLTGGDVVKAYYIAKENHKSKTDAVITVIIDRVMGLVVLAGFSAAAVLSDLTKYSDLAISIYVFLLAVFSGMLVFYSGRLRRLFSIEKILRHLPFSDLFRKVDRSVFLYRYRKRTIVLCILLTAGVHSCVILTLWTLARGLAIDITLTTCAIIVPIVLIITALPITPAGWGIGEMGFVYLFGIAGVPAVLALALSFIHRFNTLLISLSGGVFLLRGRHVPRHGKDPRDDHRDEVVQ